MFYNKWASTGSRVTLLAKILGLMWGLTAEVREETPGVRDTTKGLKEGDSRGGTGGDEEC